MWREEQRNGLFASARHSEWLRLSLPLPAADLWPVFGAFLSVAAGIHLCR